MPTRGKILIADDQPEILDALSFICSAEGYHCTTVDRPEAVIPTLRKSEYDLLLMDMNYHPDRTSGQEGLNLLRQAHQLDPALPVVVMTAWGSIPLAVDAIQAGARDFLQKPWENERLFSILRTQIELRTALKRKERLEAENRVLRSAQNAPSDFVALSPAMQEVQRVIEQVAPSDANILITGENGTGKGVVARMLHQLSTRSQQPLISVNMGGIPETLFESEMFGHVKGAFTDARSDRVGRFELADGGTLFLDEIANLTGSQQAKILRVLEIGEFEKVGSSRTQKANARVLSATNADLRRDIDAGKFREDLYFRLNTIQIHLPPLRERTDDISALVKLFLDELAGRYRKKTPEVSPKALESLQRHNWPGNVRELRHVMERAVLLCGSNTIQPSDLGLHTAQPTKASVLEEMDLESVEAHLIRKALDRHQGNAITAAKALGLSRSAFYRRLQKYKIAG
ncbi:MAG: sigma-54-dependent Fis family transcriptional regulator [Verrucomicrobia bacterium]|nr:sigma-54-dependent Fis family transcriptional regulator [Verrucomicrobiota bacterium]